ncbi:MAG: zinc ABC transporter substrate-binding protein [Anaerolineae bacterium]|nr:zinc ABC transporter substrate-binding protein [Anaerolineae bacterium]
MNINGKPSWILLILFMLMGSVVILTGCAGASTETAVSNSTSDQTTTGMLLLPALEAVPLTDKPLNVVVTTSIMGDVVAQVGGDAIELTTLMNAGQDPHSYQPGARELTAVADADIIFVNGWDLEQALADDLAEIGGGTPIVAISANIEPLRLGADSHTHEEADEEDTEAEDTHNGVDPHVWFNVQNVAQWTDNVAQVLSELDPAHAETYASNAVAYHTELDALEAYAAAQLAQIPEERRFLVTNHDAFGYLADSYGFTVIGTVIPGMSTLAEPSAKDLASLIAEMGEHDLCTIFTETTVSDTLAQTVAGELENCADVKVVKLYTGAVGLAGSGADSYTSMFRANVDAIVEGLRE